VDLITTLEVLGIASELCPTHARRSTDVAVLLTLLRFRSREGAIWPSHETLAERSKCSVTTVKRSLEHWRKVGLIDWKRTGSSNQYTFDMERARELRADRSSTTDAQDKEMGHSESEIAQSEGAIGHTEVPDRSPTSYKEQLLKSKSIKSNVEEGSSQIRTFKTQTKEQEQERDCTNSEEPNTICPSGPEVQEGMSQRTAITATEPTAQNPRGTAETTRGSAARSIAPADPDVAAQYAPHRPSTPDEIAWQQRFDNEMAHPSPRHSDALYQLIYQTDAKWQRDMCRKAWRDSPDDEVGAA